MGAWGTGIQDSDAAQDAIETMKPLWAARAIDSKRLRTLFAQLEQRCGGDSQGLLGFSDWAIDAGANLRPVASRIMRALQRERSNLEEWTSAGARKRVLDRFSVKLTASFQNPSVLPKSEPAPRQKLGTIVPKRSCEMHRLSEGLAPACIDDDSGASKYGYVDSKRRLRVPFHFEYAAPFKNGVAEVRLKARWNLIDKTGRTLLPSSVHAMERLTSTAFAVRHSRGRPWVVVDKTGHVLTRLRFSAVSVSRRPSAATPDAFDVKRGRHWGVIDEHLRFIVPPRFSLPVGLRGAGFVAACVTRKGKRLWGTVNRANRTGVPFRFDELTDADAANASIVIARRGRRFGYFEASGKSIYALTLDAAGPFSDGYAAVSDAHGGFYIDRRGRQMGRSRYEEVRPFHDGLAAVKVGTLWGFINARGKQVLKPQFSYANHFKGQRAVVQLPGRNESVVINRQGRIVGRV